MPSDFPPSSLQFRDLCREAPRKEPLAIAYTQTADDQARIQRAAQQAAQALRMHGGRDPKQWAHDLKARYLKGEKLSVQQQKMASETLNEDWMNGQCKPMREAA